MYLEDFGIEVKVWEDFLKKYWIPEEKGEGNYNGKDLPVNYVKELIGKMNMKGSEEDKINKVVLFYKVWTRKEYILIGVERMHKVLDLIIESYKEEIFDDENINVIELNEEFKELREERKEDWEELEKYEKELNENEVVKELFKYLEKNWEENFKYFEF